MNRVLACVFLSIGSILVIYGLNVLPSVRAALSSLVDGDAPDQALWFLLAGLAAILVGAGSFVGALKAGPAAGRGVSRPR